MRSDAQTPCGAKWAQVVVMLAVLAPRADASPARGEAPPQRIHPKDPLPLTTEAYLDIGVTLHRGRVAVESVRRGGFGEPRPIPRFRGRYEVRLYGGRQLQDVVRFAFPLTLPAGERTTPNIRLDRALARGVRARTSVRVPFADGINRVVLLDGHSGQQVGVSLASVTPPAPRLTPTAPGRTSIFQEPKRRRGEDSRRPGPRPQR